MEENPKTSQSEEETNQPEGFGFDYLNVTRILIGDKDVSDETLNVYLDLTRRSILNYCNISELPFELDYTLCQMCADVFRELMIKNNKGSVVGNISSMSEDGRSLSFGSGTEFLAGVEDRIAKTSELNRFKKLYRL